MPTPLATPRRREPPQPAAKPCRARSLPVWRSPTAKPAAWGCRARSLLVGHRNSILQRMGHRLYWPVPAF
uniref:Uncharacterized protein n=1 Tax=Fagus sylvatica TaxID=28930 RepID=A0A2N9F205_FAGSY